MEGDSTRAGDEWLIATADDPQLLRFPPVYRDAMPPGRVHLMYGLSGSGKTTLARALCADSGAVRFTLDEWMIRLYPDVHYESRAYGVKATGVRDMIWSIAAQVLPTGIDVVFDWNSWSASRRQWAIDHASTLHAPVIVHRISTGIDIASDRAQRRTQRGDLNAHPVTRAGNEHLDRIMEEPESEEGIEICWH